MFIEGDVEVKLKDRQALALDEHDLKIWLQRSFRDMSCYRISNFKRDLDKTLHAQVAIKINDMPENERREIEQRASDAAFLRSVIERMFVGKGSCVALGEARLRKN